MSVPYIGDWACAFEEHKPDSHKVQKVSGQIHLYLSLTGIFRIFGKYLRGLIVGMGWGLTIRLWLGPPWFNYWFSFTLAYSRISHEYSSLFIIVINLIFMFSL